MKKTRFTEAQIVGILKELDGGTPATELARKHGIHANTIRLWRDKYAGMQTSDLMRMKQPRPRTRRCGESSPAKPLRLTPSGS